MAICLYDQHDQERRRAAHAAYVSAPEYVSTEAEANARGYRKATMQDINASADARHGAPDLHCWRGGLWVRIA